MIELILTRVDIFFNWGGNLDLQDHVSFLSDVMLSKLDFILHIRARLFSLDVAAIRLLNNKEKLLRKRTPSPSIYSFLKSAVCLHIYFQNQLFVYAIFEESAKNALTESFDVWFTSTLKCKILITCHLNLQQSVKFIKLMIQKKR